MGLLLAAVNTWAATTVPGDPATPGTTLRVIAPNLLELELIQAKTPGGPAGQWNFAVPSVAIPRAEQFTVAVDERPMRVSAVGLKRRAVRAPLEGGELVVGTWIYLRLDADVSTGAKVTVSNPSGDLWTVTTLFRTQVDPLRESPAIHINQEGYLPAESKIAMIGYYLGSLGELPIPANHGFRLINTRGKTVFEGKLTARPDRGYVYSPMPYQHVYEADFSAFAVPGEYRLVVPTLGASLPFRIDDGVAMAFARAYALGIYHQRCGTDNVLPFTRFVHGACHLAPAQVPVSPTEFSSMWSRLAASVKKNDESAAKNGQVVTASVGMTPHFPFVRQGSVNVTGGHHDAGDYGKYTTNSASFIHFMLFAVDSIPGGATFDNLGLPDSGDGLPDLLQIAKWEVDFLARMQDDDGGFYFLVGPRDRAYESDVLPDQGDLQVVWPKNTAATAAAVAALAQAASSPRFREAYPAIAADCLQRAKKGWEFLMAAISRFGLQGSYQRFTHYGDTHGHDDELAWAAAELFLATGGEEYHRSFRQWCDPAGDRTRRWGWWRMSECWGNAIRSYAFAVRSGRMAVAQCDPALLAKCEREIEAAGLDALKNSDDSAYGTSFPAQTKRMRGGGWYFSLDQGFDLIVASLLDYPSGADPRPRLLEAYLANLNYEAGTNPVNLTYLTGMGQRQPRELVHQFAANDRRLLPPSGLPVGNIQAGQPYLAPYGAELGALSFPADGAASAPYAYYDRWTDTHNVSAEFVIVNQARALAGLVWLASRTDTAGQPWKPVAGKITGFPENGSAGKDVTVRLVTPDGLDVAKADIVWEAAGGVIGTGPAFSFKRDESVGSWVEAEARWPDGRRVFAAAGTEAAQERASVTITALQPVASVAQGTRAVVEFRRSGDASRELVVSFSLGGTAAKWNDYRRPEGDMPVQMTIPAGRESVTMTIQPVPSGLGAATKEIEVKIKPGATYNAGHPRAAKLTLVGSSADKRK